MSEGRNRQPDIGWQKNVRFFLLQIKIHEPAEAKAVSLCLQSPLTNRSLTHIFFNFSNGEPLKIHISDECKQMLDKIGGYVIAERGLVHLKGKGNVRTWWLVGACEGAVSSRRSEKDLKPLCRPKGLQALSSEQQNLRRRASPKMPGSGNVSRQGSFCAGSCQNNSQFQNANKGSTNFIRRPSFDPALLSLSLKAAQQQMASSGNCSVAPTNSSTFHRSTSRDSPSGTPKRKRREDALTVKRAAECSVTIEPPSDSSTIHTPNHSSPFKHVEPKVEELAQSSKEIALRKKVAFTPRIKASLGLMRECRSLDVLHSRDGVADTLKSISPSLKTRKMSKSVDIDEPLSILPPAQTSPNSTSGCDQPSCTTDHGDTSQQENAKVGYSSSSPKTQRSTMPQYYSHSSSAFQKKRPTYNKNYRNQKDLPNRSSDSLSFDSDDRHEAAFLLDPNYPYDNTSNHGDDDQEADAGHIGLKVNIQENLSEEQPLTKEGKNAHWLKLSSQMEREKKGSTLKKWFQTILNGNGIGSSGESGSKKGSVPASVHSNLTSAESKGDKKDVCEGGGEAGQMETDTHKSKSGASSSEQSRPCDVQQLVDNAESVL